MLASLADGVTLTPFQHWIILLYMPASRAPGSWVLFMQSRAHSAAPNGQGAPARSAEARPADTSGASIREASVLVCDALKALGVHCVTPESLRLAKVEDSAACAPR